MASDPIRTTDHVRTALHEAAAAYQPDRTTILARVHAGQARSDPSIGRRPEYHRRGTGFAGIATIAATVAAVFSIGVAVNWAAVRNDVPLPPAATPTATTPTAAAPTAAVSPHPTTAPTVRRTAASHSPKSRPPSTVEPSRSPTASPANTLSQRGFLWSAGAVDEHSIDNWSQSNVTLRTEATVTALRVRVRIARTQQLRNTGAWSTLLPDDFTTTVDEQPNAMVYTFVMRKGATLLPGEYRFGVQYNHAVGGRDASRDTYRATATGDGTSVEVTGGF